MTDTTAGQTTAPAERTWSSSRAARELVLRRGEFDPAVQLGHIRTAAGTAGRCAAARAASRPDRPGPQLSVPDRSDPADAAAEERSGPRRSPRGPRGRAALPALLRRRVKLRCSPA
ncbi:DUF6397 family protein [Streptomyces sp. HNM0663]|uniref:DUF6397 family protein n=1 Tax=Streptomyces chengmaiensis TaxID=3040919 RepID=A0ABT6HW30_9ACTN|nr:DUF6397 family protein [Streptomyces chengmaiensis]MDH2392536.1 DUF6397 family protein [Streptomyces chengmaiensis]